MDVIICVSHVDMCQNSLSFQHYTYSLRPFSRGGGAPDAPQAIHRFRDPPAFIGLMNDNINPLFGYEIYIK